MVQNEKLMQAVSILNELNIDMWLTLGRETSMNNDPVLPLISPIDYTAIVGLIVTKDGRVINLVGHNDAEGARQTGLYQQVISYDTSFEREIAKLICQINPSNIALNYSVHDVASDGLSYGMYMFISEILKSQNYSGSIISSSEIISRLRGRKTKLERDRIEQAINTAEIIFEDARSFIKAGKTEIEIFNFFNERVRHYGVKPSWQPSQCPGVMVGPQSVPGHNGPTGIVAKKGDVMDIDFGVLENDYCSDLQRTYYVLDDGETRACGEVQRAFDTLQEAVRRAAAFIRPGVTGTEVDAVAREYVVSQGYPEWNYALGHQVGRFAHDGGIILAPKWERYNSREISQPVQEGNVFTLEPGIATSRGYVGQEDMVYVTKGGGILISHPQKEIYIV